VAFEKKKKYLRSRTVTPRSPTGTVGVKGGEKRMGKKEEIRKVPLTLRLLSGVERGPGEKKRRRVWEENSSDTPAKCLKRFLKEAPWEANRRGLKQDTEGENFTNIRWTASSIRTHTMKVDELLKGERSLEKELLISSPKGADGYAKGGGKGKGCPRRPSMPNSSL